MPCAALRRVVLLVVMDTILQPPAHCTTFTYRVAMSVASRNHIGNLVEVLERARPIIKGWDTKEVYFKRAIMLTNNETIARGITTTMFGDLSRCKTLY